MLDQIAAGLPAPESLPPGTPRYPNLWLHVRGADGENGDDRARTLLRKAAGIVDDIPRQQNPEGSDEWGRLRQLEPVELSDENRSHDHQLHMRIYLWGLGDVQRLTVRGESLWRVGVSVHYEVDRPRSLHPYVDECPRCGCVGDFEQWRDAGIHDKNVWVHDPLGLELTTYGTVRGRQVPDVMGLLADKSLVEDYAILDSNDLSSHQIEASKVGIFVTAPG